MRLIDADAVLDRYYADWEYHCLTLGQDDREWLKQCIEQADTIEAERVKYGEWTCDDDDGFNECDWHCSKCGGRIGYRCGNPIFSKRCPSCGAKMIGKED